MTYRTQTSIIDFPSLLGANAYYRLFFVKVEHHRHAIDFFSFEAPEVVQLIPNVCPSLCAASRRSKNSTMRWEPCLFWIFNPVSCVQGTKIISVCFLWEINFWYSWRAVFLNERKALSEVAQFVVQIPIKLENKSAAPKFPLLSICFETIILYLPLITLTYFRLLWH